jgi:hypothetical protein
VSETMRIWDSLSRTDPAHTKGFKRAGGFSGTAVKPMWVIKRLTEEFGPCGEGWGINEPSFQTVPGNNGEVLVYCTVSGWCGATANVVWGVGGDKVVTYIKANEQYNRLERWENDDEAFKKAFTDAIMNAFKFLGVAADVHMGLFDDSKYVQEVKADFAERLKGNGGVSPEGEDWYGCNGEAGMSAAKAKAEGLGETFDGWLSAVDIIPTMEVWKTWCRDHDDVIKTLPRAWRVQIREAVDARKAELGAV